MTLDRLVADPGWLDRLVATGVTRPRALVVTPISFLPRRHASGLSLNLIYSCRGGSGKGA